MAEFMKSYLTGISLDEISNTTEKYSFVSKVTSRAWEPSNFCSRRIKVLLKSENTESTWELGEIQTIAQKKQLAGASLRTTFNICSY